MTIPHLMNCSHSGSGWCLDCVQRLYEGKTRRIVDIHGKVIVLPEHYHECINWGQNMIDKMEEDGVDRSDMYVVLEYLHNELAFHTRFLKKRNINGS